jgi:Na+-transporting NADH:ubiquinone oxidoreductase subunit C
MKASLYTVVYAAVLGTVCAALLTGVGRFTAPRREANASAERYRHVLEVLRVPYEEFTSPEELLALFERNVEVEEREGLRLYRYTGGEDGVLEAVAVPLSGPGLWGPIRGFLALEPDMRTIRGLTFHEQEETPGLGGEIGSERFLRQFAGKRIVGPDGAPGVRLVQEGRSEAANEFDGITGATMTGERVQAILNGAATEVVDLEAAPRREAEDGR